MKHKLTILDNLKRKSALSSHERKNIELKRTVQQLRKQSVCAVKNTAGMGIFWVQKEGRGKAHGLLITWHSIGMPAMALMAFSHQACLTESKFQALF